MIACIHCDQEVINAHFDNKSQTNSGPFCCQGCLTVFNVINFKGLTEYYEIKKNASMFKKRAPVDIRKNQFTYLDDAFFKSEYSYSNFSHSPVMEFYLEGIHCLACLWIIEKIPSFVPGVQSAKLNIGRSIVAITLKENGHFSDVARELENIGYHPHPLKINQSTRNLELKEDRAMLLKIGVAGAAAGNIMLYAISLYAGAGPVYANAFNAITVVLAFPVLVYSALPFYKNSFLALKNRSLSIDIPISIALIMGGVMGIYNLIKGVPENYFDSLTALVFLLLLSRYFLKTIQNKGLSPGDLNFFYQSESVMRQDDKKQGIFTETHPNSLKINDLIKILPNQLVPADGIVIQGETYLNNSLLSGESLLQKTKINDQVFSGSMNVSHEIIIKIQKVNADSRLGKILKKIENGWGQKGKTVELTNLVSKYFVALVFFMSVVLFILQSKNGDYKHAIEMALTLLIVTCPCALAIATPLTFIRTLSKCAQKGIIIKDDLVIEKLAKAKNIFIDKTGTLTRGSLEVISSVLITKPKIPLEDIIYNLEKQSRHPVGIALKEFVETKNPTSHDVSDFKETPGLGVCGKIEGYLYEIKNYGIYENGILLTTFITKDALRSDSHNNVQRLRDLKLRLKILSGDKKEFVKEIASNLFLSENEYSAELSPENKSQIIRSSNNSIMIGDGVNDSIALSCADTGIAVFGAMEISLRAADVYLTYPGLSPVIDLITISRETMKVIYRNLILSLLYNSVSVGLAFSGLISPLAAAIIMPLSSATVLISTLIGTKELRRQWK